MTAGDDVLVRLTPGTTTYHLGRLEAMTIPQAGLCIWLRADHSKSVRRSPSRSAGEIVPVAHLDQTTQSPDRNRSRHVAPCVI